MQLSTNNLFVFVEGWSDRYFYDTLAESRCTPVGLSHRVSTAQEISTRSVGKSGLLEFFEYLRRRGRLLSELQGKKTAIMFCFDKDVDDFRRVTKRSLHVFYTEHYDIENHLCIHGNILSAAAGRCPGRC